MDGLQLWRVFSLVAITAAWSTADSHNRQPSYLLLTPSSLQPGVETSISITILSSLPVTVSAYIAHGNQRVVFNSTTVEGGSTKLLTLPPVHESESNWYTYSLNVKGYTNNNEVFSNKTELRVGPKCLPIFIQTDKLNYKPGQKVKIRVVSIHPNGKPYNSPVDIVIRDSRGNLLRQWLALEAVHGVVSKEFQLSENPPLGRWTIIANVSNVSTEKCFTVANYVLRKFDIQINVPRRVYREDVLRGSVNAKYMYGKPVRGHVNITFLYYDRGTEVSVYKGKQIDGTADFMFDIRGYRHTKKNEQGITFYNGYVEDEFVRITVHVTDHLTGLTYNSSAMMSVAKFRYNICFDGYPQILRPSLNFTAWLKISTYNNQPLSLEDQQKTVHVSVMQQKQSPWSWEGDKEVEMVPHPSNMSGSLETVRPTPKDTLPEETEFPLPADGIIPLHIQLKDETEMLTIEAHFEDNHNTLQLYRSYTSPSHSYLQIQKPSTPLEVGFPVSLQVESNFPVTEIHYVVKSGMQVVSAGKSSGAVSVVPDMTWAPVACIIVYCVNPSGEIINDVIQLPITQNLKNKVSLSWSNTMAEPGDEVTLRVSVAEPASLVGILVVDKATHWAGSQNDITKNTVPLGMEKYGFSPGDAYFGMFRMGDPYSIFKTCDLVAMTDASLHMPGHNPEIFVDGTLPVDQTYGPDMEEKQQFQEHFPETWIWKDINTGNSVSSEIPLTVPDSITTWVATAFVMSENLGLGFIDTPAQLTAFQDFFLSLNLPTYVIRGEELLLEIILFNNLLHDLEVMVIVADSDTFHFALPDHFERATPNVHHVSVRSQDGASIHIPIRPLILGEIPITVKAMSRTTSDAVHRTVLVKAEGLEQSFSSSLLFEGSSSQLRLSRNVMFRFPTDYVKGSEKVSVTVVGDILGPSISGLEDLIRMPYGCGEQNMINFAPNIYILQYMRATGQANQEITDRARTYMITGYEQELSYQRLDGSFSAFGDHDAAGSTWLSAFVLRCFLQAQPFISIDEHVLRKVAAFLGAQQGVDGQFEEHGSVIHTELRGALDGPVSLTAYVLIALLEDNDIKAQYGSQVSEALMYLETRLALGISSNYSLSLVTYALALAGSSSARTALSELIGRAEMKDGVPMWSSPNTGMSWSWQPHSADIEMASYVLLSQRKLGFIEDGLSLMKWLSQQRNDRGGFRSTQDTVLALQALAEFAALMGSHHTDLTIKVNVDAWTTVASFHVDQDNYLVHQSQQIEAEEELNLQVTAEGRGLALFQLNVFYNAWSDEPTRRQRDPERYEAFNLHVEFSDFDRKSAQLYICWSLVKGLGLNATGMAILEVGLLSGFSLLPDGIRPDDLIKKVELQAGKVILYLDSVTTDNMCRTIPLFVEYNVARVQERSVLLCDYYESSRKAVRMYNSAWRNELTSVTFCGEHSGDCTGTIFDSTVATHCSRHGLLALLLPLIFFTI